MASSFELDCSVEKIDFENVAMDLQILLVIKRISYLNVLQTVDFFMNNTIKTEMKIKMMQKTIKQFVIA